MRVETLDAELEDEVGLIVASIVDTNGRPWVGIQIKLARISLDPERARQVAQALLTAATEVEQGRAGRYDA